MSNNTTTTNETSTIKALASSVSLKKWLVLCLVLVVLDQLTKLWIIKHFEFRDSVVITSFFNIVRVHNEGAAFSFLADAGGWQRWFFTILAIAAIALISNMLRHSLENKRLSLALTFILSGAIGNLIDRVSYGYVVDFLDFHHAVLASIFYAGHFPAFNVADSAITIGAIVLIWDELSNSLGKKSSN
jgi:signal peptidase II